MFVEPVNTAFVSAYVLIAPCVASSVALVPNEPLSIPVTVAPVANAKLVFKLAAPVTLTASLIVICVESSELISVPVNLTAPTLTSPVPAALNSKSAFVLEVVITLSLIVMSAILTPPVPCP